MSFLPYEEQASRYFSQYQSVVFEDVHADWLDLLPEQSGMALDVGAGSGRDARALAERGWQVCAVEPAANLRALGREVTAGCDVTWLDDTLPALEKVRSLGTAYQLILVSAVWMHLRPDEQSRALRVLASLLAPGGLLVITYRVGESGDDRVFHPVNASQLDAWAQDYALIPLRGNRSEDRLGRGVQWQLHAYRLPDDGTGALPVLRHVIVNDSKASTYKLALLRTLARLADSAPGVVLSRDEGWVTLPLGAVGLYWIKLYHPLILRHQLRQTPGNRGLGFVTRDFQALANVSPADLRIGSPFLDPVQGATVLRAIRDAGRTILKMPTTYTTWPGSDRQIFEGGLGGKRIRSGPVRLDLETLSELGTFRVPVSIWDSLSRYACWLEPAINQEWIALMKDFDASRSLAELHGAIAWQESARDTTVVRSLVQRRLGEGVLPCTWTDRPLRERHTAIDHCFPWARWNNNDLWNLLPTTDKANAAKSDRLPAAGLMQEARDRVLDWWEHVLAHDTLEQRFRVEASVALPLVEEGSSVEEIFEGALHQRQRLKANQQLPEWAGLNTRMD
ncbi:MAG: methyltransferase domain-containing protein [Spiribacter salinus]|uniref:Methyltransferase domain-containing protein n=1 Tax=Spiribacter salinus TaxID=1335746 RepID=A0A540VR83_9GAMM|nr:MAG: methyltransferase domain-containing protein [Spiribacter salinus]